jgi:hypothetical protein
MATLPHKLAIGIVLLAGLAVPTSGGPAIDPTDKVSEFALSLLLKDNDDPPESGLQLKLTKADTAERDGRKLLRVHWSLQYTGKRWPLVILEPSLDRETDGQTDLTLLATGKSGNTYGWTARSPRPLLADAFLIHSELDWFVEIQKIPGRAEGVLEIDLGEARGRFLKQLPNEFSAEVTPTLYVWMHHRPRDRAEHLHLDAWTGRLTARPIKVSIDKW